MLLPNVMNKQLNKEQKLSASKGPWRQVQENEALEFGSLLLQKAVVKTEKNPAHAQKGVCI